MQLTTLIPFVVSSLLLGVVIGETCFNHSDCIGNTFDGTYCNSQVCVCDQSHACTAPEYPSGIGQAPSCTVDEDCPGYAVFTGISCVSGTGPRRCRCDETKACIDVCRNMTVESINYQYGETTLHDTQTIERVFVASMISSSACNYSQDTVASDYSGTGVYGYSGNLLWVHGGCSAVFTVCYTGTTRHIRKNVKRSSGDQTVHICEGNTEIISCTDSQTYITVTFASYGRTSTQVCIDTTLPTNTVGCHSDVTEEVRISCADLNSCDLEASNDKFGDSCPGYYKYLEVTYQCITDPKTTTSTSTKTTQSATTTSTIQGAGLSTSPLTAKPTSTTPKPENCILNIQCSGSCKKILNPQEELIVTVDVGCSTEIVKVDLIVHECTDNTCTLNWLVDQKTFMGNSVTYQPKQSDMTLYRLGFFTVHLVTGETLDASHTVQFGPIPEAGTCSIAPQTGYALSTQYNLTCTGFSVTDGHQLKYSIHTYHEDNYNKASKIFTGTDSNRYNMLLQPGQEANNFTIYVWVKAFVSYGAFVKFNTQTQVYPPSYAGDVDIVDLAESFVTVEGGHGSSLIEDLITRGNTDEASQLLGVITASLNLDTNNGTKTDADNIKRQNVRTAIVTVLTELPVTDIDSVSSTVSILNGATEHTGEVSQEAQDVATDLYSNLADGFDQFIGQQSSSEAIDTAGSILTGVTRILDLNTDSGLSHVNQSTTLETSEAHTTDKVVKARNSTEKLLKTIDTVSSTMMVQQPTGGNTTMFFTESMTIGIQKLTRHGLSKASYSVTGEGNNTGDFVFPNIASKLASGQDFGVKMMYMKKNPYVWSDSSRDVTSPVMAVSLNSGNNTAVNVDNLDEPVAISLTNFGPEASSVHTFQVALRKTVGNSTDKVTGNLTGNVTGSVTSNVTGNFTFLASRANMLSFNVSAVTGRTLTINIAPVSNVTSFKMLIRTDRKPSFDDIINEGFLYPDELQHSHFASFKYLQTNYTPASLDAERTIYITEDSPFLSSSNFSGTYYIGLTLDLNHTETVDTLIADYRDCLGSNVTDCSDVVNVTIDIQTKQLGCIYWVEGNKTWSSQGCEVSPYTTRDQIECLCSHLTAFSGSILVLPNMVDPFDVSLFLTFFDNPVVVTAVIIVWVIYFFLIHWARQEDKKDTEKVGVINCLDNSPTDNYIYLVCVVTGWWRDAGTTANVFIYLKGSKASSPTHCLSTTARPCFQTGSEDWFLVTTEHSLGELREVTLWHDNMGVNPSWYLNHVYVKDIQLHKSWHFIYNDWLAVNRGALQQTSATLEAVTEEQLKFKQKHNFVMKSTQDLRDGHLWISIFSKPAKSTFTRVQRLTCALSLLLTTMLTNIMFYGIPTDDPEDQVGEAGGITISSSSIIIGIESSLIMFPINLLILQLFLKVKQKPRPHEKEISAETYRYLASMYETGSKLTDLVINSMMEKLTSKMGDFDQQSSDKDLASVDKRSDKSTDDMDNGVYSDTDRSSNRSFNTPKQNPSTVSIKSSLDSVKIKSSKILPWWFLYIAWVIVISTCLICSYFVMLYGLKYGYNRSVSWLVSFLTGFTQSAFVTQPLKVIGIAVVITLIFKKPAEFDDFGPDVELDEDEIYLHEVVGAEEIHHPTVQPLSKSLLQKIRDRLYVEWLMDMTLRDIVLYAIYLGIVTFLVHAHRNIKLAYRNNVAIEDVLVNPGCIKLHKCFFLAKADKVELMYQYFEDVLFPSLADMSVADHDYATPGSSHFLLGPFRLRQQRIESGTCKSTHRSLSARFGETFPECVGSYWLGDEDTGSYNNSWAKPLTDPPTDGVDHWSHQSMWKLKTVPYSGIHATYSGGGYVLEFPQAADWTSILDSMKNTDWIDPRTRAIFAEFNLYNPNADLFSVVMIFFEFTNIGGIFPNHQIFTAKLYHYSSNIGTYVATCEFFFLLFNIAFTYIEVKRYKKLGKKQYFEDIWSIGEVIQLALSYTVIGLFFKRMLSVNDIMYDFRMSDGQTFISFYTAIAWDFILGYVMAFQLAFVTLKSVKLLRFNKRMFMISDTITFARSNLISFAFMFVVFMIAFGHFTSQAFGSILYGYKNFGSSIFTMLNFALGASDLPGMYAANRILGPIFFAVFVFFSQWCFLTIFVAILNFGISDSKTKSEERRNKFELIDYVLDKVKSVF